MKTTEEMIEVLTAYKQGKVIEAKHKDDNTKWYVPTVPCWDWSNYDYRIKSEPKYRPFKDVEELIEFWNKKINEKESIRLDTALPFTWAEEKDTKRIINVLPPLIWIKEKDTKRTISILGFDKENNKVLTYTIGCTLITLDTLFNYFTFVDGTPCGVAE